MPEVYTGSMYALISDQGTAVNPGLCRLHIDDAVATHNLRKLVYNTMADIQSPWHASFVDVSENEAVYCYVCGNYADGSDKGPLDG